MRGWRGSGRGPGSGRAARARDRPGVAHRGRRAAATGDLVNDPELARPHDDLANNRDQDSGQGVPRGAGGSGRRGRRRVNDGPRPPEVEGGRGGASGRRTSA